ncbi:MAG: HAD family hydrolase [Clostridiales bacterium]|nr:HAD family hydrolase [Clostridiales bacterium]
MRYTDLIFDLYGTLVDIHTEENDLVWDKTALYFGYYGAPCTGKELKTDFESVMTSRESVAGQSYEVYPDIPFDEVMADLFRARGVTENANVLGFNAAQVFRVASTEYIRLYDRVLESLDALRQKGFRLWLLSNAQRSFTAYELRLLGLDTRFDRIYLSSDYQCRKPDGRFFSALLEGEHLDASRCLMIGNDRETDIAGATAAGLSTLYMHTNLTPAEQAPADPGKVAKDVSGQCHYEFEGANWPALTTLIAGL